MSAHNGNFGFMYEGLYQECGCICPVRPSVQTWYANHVRFSRFGSVDLSVVRTWELVLEYLMKGI
jgi:hypothetical protein